MDVYHKQGFFCSDKSLMFSSREDTVPTKYVILGGIGVVPILISMTSALIGHDLSMIRRTLTIYYFCGSLLYFCVNATKTLSGQLRPDFFQVCQPDWTKLNCSSFVEHYVCTGNDVDAIRNASRRFPSGHAAITTFCTVYLLLYSHKFMLKKLQTRWLLFHLPQALLIQCDVFVCVSRTTDNKHLPCDVIVGAISGLLTGFISIYWTNVEDCQADGDSKTFKKLKTN